MPLSVRSDIFKTYIRKYNICMYVFMRFVMITFMDIVNINHITD